MIDVVIYRGSDALYGWVFDILQAAGLLPASEHSPVRFTVGDDGEALAVVPGLVRDAGFEPVVVGKLVDARRFQRGGPGYGPIGDRGRA